ncbi:MAG: PilC/PilY family type IV pilus protein [Halioglobus sp.]
MNKFLWIIAACCTFSVAKVSADDIDIYLSGPAAGGSGYVTLMLDYRPSVFSSLCTIGSTCNTVDANGDCPSGVCFSAETYADLPASGTVTRFDAFRLVLGTVFSNSLFDDIYMSLMISNDVNGGTILEGYKRLGGYYIPADPNEVLPSTTDAVEGRVKLITTMQAIPTNPSNSDAHKLQPKETYLEWMRYVNGAAIEFGRSTSGNFGSAGTPNPDYDPSIIDPSSPSNYLSPFIDPNSCSKMFSIMVSMNSANQDSSLDSEIGAALSRMTGRTISTGGSFDFEDLMDVLHDSGTDIVSDLKLGGINPLEKTWVISDSGSLGATGDWASAGGSGSPLDIDQPGQLEIDLVNAFKEVLGVSSTFVAASVPVNVFNRAESLDNLFVALFEAKAGQDWPGNIKKLKLYDSDADGKFDDVIDATTPTPKPGFASTGPDRGRITFDALTYWTIAAELPSVLATIAPNGADGREVARGGAGQKITGFLANATHAIGDTNAAAAGVSHRQVYVEPASFINGVATAFDDFDVDAGTLGLTGIKAALGNAAMSDAVALDLIRWGRGQDVATGNARDWIMSDAIHSRPLAINYGAQGGYSVTNPNIRLFFGSGDGLFHILENTTSGGAESGEELFAFYPRELLGNIEIRKTNTEPSLKMRYGADGPPVALVVDNNFDGNLVASGAAPTGGDKVYVYFGLRRGGNSYYALDVSDPDATPKIIWKITQTSGGDFDELGLTFSKPLVGKVNYDGTPRDVLIFSGGYNGGWDAGYINRIGKDLNSNPDNVGAAIYIVDALNGDLLWKATQGSGAPTNTEVQHPDLVDSIPSDITPVENISGIIERLYVGDTGGAVWRVDIPALVSDVRASTWFISKLAELGNDGSTAASDRRFFHAPDVVETFDEVGNFDGVIISSGDRAHPNETAVTNYHFYLKDRKISNGDATVLLRTPITVADMPDQVLCVLGTEPSCSSSYPNGWKLQLSGLGEKGLSTALVDGGRVFMSTFIPALPGATCAPTEGQGLVYVVNLKDGTATYEEPKFDAGSGIPSEAIALGDSLLIPLAGIDPTDPTDPNDPPCEGKLCGSLTEKTHRIYWRESGIDKL